MQTDGERWKNPITKSQQDYIVRTGPSWWGDRYYKSFSNFILVNRQEIDLCSDDYRSNCNLPTPSGSSSDTILRNSEISLSFQAACKTGNSTLSKHLTPCPGLLHRGEAALSLKLVDPKRQAECQDVTYPDKTRFDSVLGKLRRLPPLVSPEEIDRLREQLADVARGKAFLLQGGDCAELFDDCSQDPIEHKLSLCVISESFAHTSRVLLMSLIILHGSRLPVVRIMRIAGQYAKPRSKPTEIVDGKEVLSFRGDNVNGYDVDDREPDPQRLLGAYFHSTATLNFIRTLLSSGFADLHKPLEWSFSHVRSPELQQAFSSVIDSLKDSLDFMKVATGGAGGSDRGGSKTVDLFTSHEALLLEYEEALTRQSVTSSSPPTSRSNSRARLDDVSPSPVRSSQIAPEGKHYNVSSHFIWIGDRTRQLDGAHVEYFRGIANPMWVNLAGPC